ncbi:MAG: hypothetical protein AABX52_00520 [Nanoarchaeota archaeon]
MKITAIKLIAVLVIIILLLNITLLVLKIISSRIFWMIIIAAGMIAYIMNKKSQPGQSPGVFFNLK